MNNFKNNDSQIDDAPIVRFVHKVLLDSIKNGAEEVHFKRDNEKFYVYYKVDGEMQEAAKPPASLWGKTISRIKVMARMGDYGPQKSEDGDTLLKLNDKVTIKFYVTTNPDPSSDTMVVLQITGAKLEYWYIIGTELHLI